MGIAARLLEFVACPRCYGKLTNDGGQRLKCVACQLYFPIRENVPHLIIDEALDARSGAKASVVSSQNAVRFREKRPNAAPRSFYLEQGSCKVIGRPPGDSEKTSVMVMDMPLVMDESTKGLVQQYIHKQFGQDLDRFRRTSDVIVEDGAVSRLHAMVFFDGQRIGVLDLVSKNGTYVNGQEVESRLLKTGDVIEIGDTKIIYEG